jgi:hypothetical protein
MTPCMSTLAEVEAAADCLPLPQQRELLQHLAAKLHIPPTVPPAQSLHDRMQDLCGIVDSGLTDLSTNKQYLEGLGRPRA